MELAFPWERYNKTTQINVDHQLVISALKRNKTQEENREGAP